MAILKNDGQAPLPDASEIVPLEAEVPHAPPPPQPRFRFVMPGAGAPRPQATGSVGRPAAQAYTRESSIPPAQPRPAAAPAARTAAAAAPIARPARAPAAAPAGPGYRGASANTRPPARLNRPKPTPEQQAVIDDQSDVVVAKALAGSGKTTTSVGFTEARPHEKTLYVCFNKQNAEEARGRFPQHVTCRTSHSIAYARLDERTRARVPRSWNARVILDDLQALTGRAPQWAEAAIIARLFQDFFADTAPKVDVDLHSSRARAHDPNVRPLKLNDCARQANILWADMCNPNGRCRIPHDGYLKNFVLGRPRLGFDRVIFEEAQDGNPLMNALVRQQVEYGAKLLILGDEHQSIYQFRGAYNAFGDLPEGASVHTLTNTWRFGPNTAGQVNLLLAAFKPDEAARIVGCGEDRPWDDRTVTTHLARTNAQLFEMAVAHVERHDQGRIHWVGGIHGYRVHMLLDAYALWEGRKSEVQDELLRRFNTWEELHQYAEATQDPDARILHRLVEDYRHRIPELVERIDARVAPTLEGASISLGTGHKSKGLEFPQVQLCDDFDKSFERVLAAYEMNEAGPDEEQEINLLYVALSRGKYSARPSPGLASWMEQQREVERARVQAQERRSAAMRDRP